MESTPVVGNSFTNTHRNWKEGMYKNFKEWSVKQFDYQNMESSNEAEVPVQFQKAKDICFKKNQHREFILPPMQNFKTIKQKQRVVQGYIGAVYSESIYNLSF